MNQIRNLILNVIWNVLLVLILVLLNTYSLTKLPWYGIMFVTLFEMCIIQWVINKVTNEDETQRHAYPPLAIVILAVLLFFFFYKRKFRLLQSQDYKTFAFCADGTVNIFYFDLMKFELLNDISFDGSEEAKQKVIAQIDYEVRVRKPRPKSEYDFNSWDGTLDEASKRNKTIKNIIK